MDFSAGQVQLINPIKKDTSKLFNEEGFEEGGGKVGGTKLLFSALLTEAGVGVIVGLYVWVEERACDGLEMDWSPCQVVGKQDPEAVLTEDGTECHLENKKETNRQVTRNLCQMGSWFGKPFPSSPFKWEHVL